MIIIYFLILKFEFFNELFYCKKILMYNRLFNACDHVTHSVTQVCIPKLP